MSFEIDDDGDLLWTNENGDWHREKGPALTTPTGYIEYRFNGRLHKLDGPAIIHWNGFKLYFIHDKGYSKEEYCTIVKEL